VNAINRRSASVNAFLTFALCLLPFALSGRQERPTGEGFSFKTGVALINVAVTVTDASGRFASGLRKEDFVVYEDGKPQTVSQFDAERVPVSLGIALDTSGSMLGEKMAAAQAALNRFLIDLLGPQDEVFLYRFDTRPALVHPWTADRAAVSRALGAVQPHGGTAMYDTIAEAIPMSQAGTRRKKALVVISDGQDTSSQVRVPELQAQIRETEVMVYAIGIDASGGPGYSSRPAPSGSPGAVPVPSPFPGKKPPPAAPRPPPPPMPGTRGGKASDRVNVDALRAITDDSGGRTEIIYSNRDLDPATLNPKAKLHDLVQDRLRGGALASIPFFDNLFPANLVGVLNNDPVVQSFCGSDSVNLCFPTTWTNTQAFYGMQSRGGGGHPNNPFALFAGNDWTDTEALVDIALFDAGLPTRFMQQQYGALSAWSTIGNSFYNAMTVTVRQRLKSLTMDFNYTFSHSLDDASGLQSAGAYGSAFIVNPIRQGDWYGNSDFDIRHNLALSAVYEIPSPSNRIARASNIRSRPTRPSPKPTISRTASSAIIDPITPVSAPRMPASAQAGIVPGGGGSGNRQR
jgi:VWFA-related protein